MWGPERGDGGLGVVEKVLESSCRLPVADQLPVLVAVTNVVVVVVAVAGAATLAVVAVVVVVVLVVCQIS